VVAPTVALLLSAAIKEPSALKPELLVWAGIVAMLELIPVPLWRGTTVSMSFPLLMAVAFLNYSPAAAALTALIGSVDPREFKREFGPLRALFNRCQVSLAVLAASLIFHGVASIHKSPSLVLFGAAMLAATADYIVNSGLVTIAASLFYKVPPSRVMGQLKVGRLSEFFVSYVGLGTLGLILAKFFSLSGIGFWSVPFFILPLLLARQMFFRSKALEEAHKELQDREQILRTLSNRMAEERQDERLQIAGFLHDDLAQHLFRLSIQVDVARRHLSAGKLEDTEATLEEIKETKNRTSDRIRALIRDLHRSPLGRAGLGEALRSFMAEMGRGSDVLFHADIQEVDIPAPIALLLYHIAREGVMNALKHAGAANMWLSVRQDGDEVEMVLRDDGTGFDPSGPGPEGHYGMTMMRERATVGRGTFTLSSAPQEGTTITVRFPTSWLQEEMPERPAEVPGTQPTQAGAAPDTDRSPRSSSLPGSVRA
jgi:signal transduction histidine kinase